MKRKLLSLVAAVLCLSMLMGLCAFAATSDKTGASSSTTKNTSSSSEESEKKPGVPYIDYGYIIHHDSMVNNYRIGVAVTEKGAVRCSSDYSTVNDKEMIATVFPGKDAYAQALNEMTVGKNALTGAFKLRMYKAGQAVWNGFGTFNVRISVGTKYEGMTVNAYLVGQDGTLTVIPCVVKKGYVTIPLTQMGTVKLALD